MDEQERYDLRLALGGLHVDAAPFTDCLWVILAEHFEDHPSCPEIDPDPDEFGFGEWVMHESDRALDVIIGLIEKRESDLRAALAAATERAEAAEGYIAKIEAIRGKKLGVPCCCDFADDDGETVIVECNYHRAIREERDAAIARADALAAWLLDAPRLVPIDIASRCGCYRPRPLRTGAKGMHCPTCGVEITPSNAGGYRTYCEGCLGSIQYER